MSNERFLIIGRSLAKLDFEAFGEVSGGIESYSIRYFFY
jgi:hypothetical protein